ncbi:hypothetical protein BDW68DRAFT_72015 [Aspergillus falconensis]
MSRGLRSRSLAAISGSFARQAGTVAMAAAPAGHQRSKSSTSFKIQRSNNNTGLPLTLNGGCEESFSNAMDFCRYADPLLSQPLLCPTDLPDGAGISRIHSLLRIPAAWPLGSTCKTVKKTCHQDPGKLARSTEFRSDPVLSISASFATRSLGPNSSLGDFCLILTNGLLPVAIWLLDGYAVHNLHPMALDSLTPMLPALGQHRN